MTSFRNKKNIINIMKSFKPNLDINKLNIKFKKYKPYSFNKLKITKLNSPQHNAECENMEKNVDNILNTFSVNDYISARTGMEYAVNLIERVIKKSKLSFDNLSILEFGAGTCKLSAVISKLFNIKEIVCVDHAEKLLTEIAPRVISLIGGDLSKFEFKVGDMNDVPKMNRKFNVIICYGAVHHLYLPEFFFSQINNILFKDSKILILDEPTIPNIAILPGSRASKYLTQHYAKRYKGENENIYNIKQYHKIFGDKFNTKLIHTTKYSQLNPYIPWNVFKSNFLLTLV